MRWTSLSLATALLVALVASSPSRTADDAPRSPIATPGAATGSARPRVLHVRPDVVRGRGGVKLLVQGRGFTASSTVTVGGRRARVLAVRNADTLVAVAPAGLGAEIVRVTSTRSTSAANARSLVHYVSRVLVVGDSLGIDLGWGFTPQLDARDGLRVVDDAVGSTGLVRSDFYDWPAHLRDDVASVRPDVVVALFGTNDDQGFETARGPIEPGTSAWDATYAARVRALTSIVRDCGARLVWVSLPRMGPSSDVSAAYVEGLVSLDRRVLATRRGAVFVDAWRTFTTPSGAYTPYVQVAPGVWALGHAPDGTHLTTAGAVALDAEGMALLVRALRR